MATTLPYAYPFDPTGTLASNKITGEQQVLTVANFRDFHYIVPTYAPFFAVGLVVKYRDLSNVVHTLVEGVDYLLTHWFISASRACATPIYGSISFLNLQLAGVIILDYQTLGGMWTQDTPKINEILADMIHNPRTTVWDVVVDLPVTFPVIDHEWDLVDMVGASGVVAAIGTIESALRQTGVAGLADHLVDFGNPHRVTAAQVGLGNVQNFGVADGPATTLGISASLYVTPFGMKAALDAGPNAAITAHVNNNVNPHAVTAAQVGAYTQVQVNSLLAAKLSTGGVAFDTSRFDGLSSIEYRDWALSTGVAANSLKFNGLTAGDYAVQVLLGTAANATLFNGKSYAQMLLDTAAQQSGDAAKFGGLTPTQFKADVLSGTAANSVLFNGLTQQQFEAHLGTIFGGVGSVTLRGFQDYTDIDSAGTYWWELGRAYFAGTDPLSSAQDLHWLVAGGDSANGRLSALRLLHLSTRGATGDGVTHTLMNFDGTADAAQLGYTVEMLDNGSGTMISTVRVWLKTAENHGTVTVTELAQGTSKVLGASAAVTVAPAGIVYLAEDISGLASAASVTQLRTDVQTALDTLTTAFTNLATQVTAS